jgi:hypothetical protein
MYTDSYALGSTMVAVGLSAPTQFLPAKNVNGVWFKYLSGGSVFLGAGVSQIPGATMMVIGSEIVSAGGPATFFLYATGATALVGVGVSYSRGLSNTIAG